MRTPDQIVSAWRARKNQMAKVLTAGEQLRRVYNGEWLIPLPELERAEKQSVANLIQAGIDQHALRIASVVPGIICPPLKATKQATDRADDRRLALQAWWYENAVPRKLRRRARHLVGYATSPVLVRPGKNDIPRWEVRDPLATFPSPMDPDELVPEDCIFSFRRSVGYLRTHYDNLAFAPLGTDRSPVTNDTMVDVLHYIDADQITMVAVGKEANQEGRLPSIELGTVENRAGRPLVVIPGRVTLDKLQGQFDQLIGMYEAQGLLWALHLHAVKRAIFGETWLEARQGEEPVVHVPADPYQGDIGITSGGVLQQFRTDPGVQTLPAMDRLERAERLTGAVPAEFGGEAPSNVRTARRGGQVLSAAVDFPIQEHQELLAASLEKENHIAIAIAKSYWGGTKRTFAVPFGRGQVVYTPNETFDTDTHRVSYAYSGTDTNGLVIEGGQRVAQETLSRYSFMLIDPMVTDPDAEHDRIVNERLERATLASIEQQAANPMGPFQPIDMARLYELTYEKNMPVYQALQKVHEEAQQRQAQTQQTPEQPEQPGLSTPGAPGTAQAGIPAIGPASPSQQNLVQILQSIRRPQTGPLGTGERLAPQGAA